MTRHDDGHVVLVPPAPGPFEQLGREADDLVDAAPTSWYDLLEPSEANKGKVTMMGTEPIIAPYTTNATDPISEIARKRTTDVIASDTTTSADATYPMSSVLLKSMLTVYPRV